MKLSIISPDLGEACYIYRGRAWTQLGVDYRTYDGKKGFHLFDAVMFADSVLMCRPWNAQHVGIARTIKDAGRALLLDFDDDYSRLPPWNPNAHHFKDCLPHLNALVQLADAITVTTKALADAVCEWGADAKKIVIVPNAIDDSWKTMKPKKDRNPMVLFRGSNTHSADLDVGRQYLTEMNKTHEIVFFGEPPAYAYTLRHRVFSVTDYSNFIVSMNNLAPEIMAVPLADHPFNHAKSDVAAQEAALIGAKLWHNGVGEFRQHAVNEIPKARWLSDVNHLRSEVLNSL
jgi:hypothetical protein